VYVFSTYKFYFSATVMNTYKLFYFITDVKIVSVIVNNFNV